MEMMVGWESISNPIVGETGLGKYKVTGYSEDWKHTQGNHFTGGGFPNNINVSIMDKIMSAGRSVISHYDPDYYTEKVGLVCTIRPYVQVPHQDFDHCSDVRGVILHAPLCEEGSYIYVWKSKCRHMPTERELLYIPFGSMLVLDGNVWHGGIVGSPGNVRFHAAILPTVDTTMSDQLVYCHGDKQWYRKLKFVPRSAIHVLPEADAKEIKKIILYIKHTFCVPDSLFSPLPISK